MMRFASVHGRSRPVLHNTPRPRSLAPKPAEMCLRVVLAHYQKLPEYLPATLAFGLQSWSCPDQTAGPVTVGSRVKAVHARHTIRRQGRLLQWY